MIKFDGTGHCKPQGLVSVAVAVVDVGAIADVEVDLVEVVDAGRVIAVVEVALLEVVVFFGP